MNLYTIHSGDEFDGHECYSVLKGPHGFECWLTEPEDRSWTRDGAAVVARLEWLEQQLATLTQERNKYLTERDRVIAWRKADEEIIKGQSEQLTTAQARMRAIEQERAVKSLTICRKCGDRYETTFEYGVIALHTPEPTNEVYALKYSNDRLREQITALQHENALLATQRPPEPTRSACGHYDCNEEDCYGK